LNRNCAGLCNVPSGSVSIAIVTFNSSRYIRRCLEAALAQEGAPLKVVVVDNASTDDTPSILRSFRSRIRLIRNPSNIGFAAGQNMAIQASRGADWVLTLNPDVLLEAGFIQRLVESGASDSSVGAVCGKLLSIAPGFEPLPVPRIDSAGMYFTPNMRHFDRGWHEREQHRYDTAEYVFGASAAAALYRREAIDDISIEGHFFDPDFFVYREDADVAWRAQLMGWRCLYTPSAVGHHVRTVTPMNRSSVPALLNMHSVKNRFLMRIKNATPSLYRRYWLPMTLRDLVVVGGAMFWEPSSLPAFWRVAKCLPRALKQRRQIMARRRVSDEELVELFNAPARGRVVAAAAEESYVYPN
jgi:GT2 family glycosyltransferase